MHQDMIGNTGASSDKHNTMDAVLIHLAVEDRDLSAALVRLTPSTFGTCQRLRHDRYPHLSPPPRTFLQARAHRRFPELRRLWRPLSKKLRSKSKQPHDCRYKDTNSTHRDLLTHQGYYKITEDEREIKAEESDSSPTRWAFLCSLLVCHCTHLAHGWIPQR
ncbi:hypothetical protein C1H46_025343 [Malus baccata]|uniref:Uncharacterized protein n=1 Tax=Malus baccata TaxID=106549 RepID=A0A540LRK0_MALBA|nr:hypothetical protein C1H46_025343 [Malus baccata]